MMTVTVACSKEELLFTVSNYHYYYVVCVINQMS